MNPTTLNLKYLIQKTNEDNSLLALNIIDNQYYTLRRIPSSDTLGRHDLESIWKNSTQAVSDSFVSYHSAGVVCSINNSYVSKEGYFLAEPYVEATNIIKAGLSAKELEETLEKIANEIQLLSFQKLAHNNLSPSSIHLSENNVFLVNSRAVTFVRGKPSHKKEIHSVIESLIKAGIKISPQIEKEITEGKGFSKAQNNLARKQCPSSWLMGLEMVPTDIAYRLSTCINLGYPIVHIKGRWDNGLDIIAKEVSTFREIAGRITLLIESRKINEINRRIKKLIPDLPSVHSNPLVSFIKSNSHLPIEIFLLHKSGDSNSIVTDLSKFFSLQKNNKMSLVVFSEQDITPFSPDYIINTFTPPTEVSLIATRALASSEQTQWVSRFSNVTPLETYLLLTSNFDTLSQNNDRYVYYAAQLLPGILLETATRASENLTSTQTKINDSNECNIAVTEGRIWPLSTKTQYSTENVTELKNSLFDTLCIEKYLRYPEIIWLLDISLQTNDPMQLRKAGEAFLRYWNSRGQDLGVKRIFPLFKKAKLFLRSICSDDTLSEFIRGTIEDFYQSTDIIAKLFDTLHPLSDLAGGNANLRASILTLTVWVESVTKEESEVIDLTLEAIGKNINFPKAQKLLFRIFIFSTPSLLKLKQKSILKAILKYEQRATQKEFATEIAFAQQMYAIVLSKCGNYEEAKKLFKKIAPPDPILFPWTAYQYYKYCSLFTGRAGQLSDGIPELGKALLASSFSKNRILAYNSIFSFDLTLLSVGHYTWGSILDRVRWFKTIFTYYGARRLIALIDSNLIIAHLSLLNRNTSLQHCESILKNSPDLIRGSLTSCTYSLASLAFLTQQPEKAASILNFLKQSGAVLIPGILEGVEHFILTSSTEKLREMGELRVFAETINLISSKHTNNSWFASLKEEENKVTPEIILNFCRRGYLLQAYVLLLIGTANGELKAEFFEKNKWLFQAIDTRFKRAGFLKLSLLKTPLELVTDILHNQTAENKTREDNYSSDGNRLLSSTQICKTLVAQLEVEKVWVLRKAIDSIKILSSSEDNISTILPNWVTVALEWLNDSAYDRIDIPSEGWIRGYPHPGVFVIEIKHSKQPENAHQFYIAVESLKPGKVLNKHKVEKLALISGLLTQATLYEKKIPQLKGTLISEI